MYSLSDKFLHNMSIRNQIICSILIFLIVPFILMFYYIDKPLEKAIEAKIAKSAQQALYLENMNIENIVEDMYKSAAQISVDPALLQMLKNPEQFSEYDQLQLKQSIVTRLSSSNYTALVTVMDLNHHLFSTRYTEQEKYGELTRTAWYKELMEDPNKSIWLFNSSNYTFADQRPVISLAKNVFDPQTHQKIGVLLFSAAEEDFSKYLSGMGGDVYLIDQQGTVISSPDKTKLGTDLSKESFIPKADAALSGDFIVNKGKGKWIVNHYTINQTGWRLIQVTPYDTVFKEIFDIRRTNIVIAGLIFILFIIITFPISYSISRPLKLLGKKMQEAENNHFNSVLSVTGPKEISVLMVKYNNMLGQIKDLLQRLKEQYRLKEEMRFKAMQAVINPHFILNTLNNIKWMAYIRNDRSVGQMLSRMSNLMEASIGRGGSLVTLQEEIAYIEDYITLMKIKYNEKLSIHYDIPEQLLNAEVIKFMLQPVIENCIYHGIEPLKGQGEIFVRAERRAWKC
ncbi:hypothetical protein SD70_22130 [Gordoniibacillus kamchatkensis]|uniref:HAMP domain-containing protein n=1 Tax=Gordoniibacillus kamchatkensis TaxID=1590651 RepID=A0ABR5AEX6_9BACL|nr:sensor histidine kinase [Paenibacillus sp. VKM B-2647]KIL39130.1 hypothetical protein SD70_22130 [Paenibacillus sp. VKM B-2647]